jgi:hypothetical protein
LKIITIKRTIIEIIITGKDKVSIEKTEEEQRMEKEKDSLVSIDKAITIAIVEIQKILIILNRKDIETIIPIITIEIQIINRITTNMIIIKTRGIIDLIIPTEEIEKEDSKENRDLIMKIKGIKVIINLTLKVLSLKK